MFWKGESRSKLLRENKVNSLEVCLFVCFFFFFLELRIKKRSLPFIERGKAKGDEVGLREGRVLEAKEIIA